MRVLLTGASGGIGGALARALASDGHALLLQGRDTGRLAAVKATIPTADCDVIRADLTDAGDRQLVCAAASAFGVDTLCNNAGINQFGAFTESAAARIIDTNVTATLQLTQALLPVLLRHPSPRIVVIGSALGAIGFPGYVAYCASKFALRGFTEALAREYADTPLTVHYVSPRATATPMNGDNVDALNDALGTETDTPEAVAAQGLKAIRKDQRRSQIGRAEALQSTLNAVAPSLVDGALRRQLPRIKQFFEETPHV